MKKQKQYIYITQATLEPAACKIGITDNLERRLKDYNSTTGKSKSNQHQYLFACEVKDMRIVENDIKNKFSQMREMSSREIYFYNQTWFDIYVDFIKKHKLFKKEIFSKPDEKKTKIIIVKKTTPTLEERGLTKKDVMQKARKAKYDEFYTRYEDIEKEISMYLKEIWKDKVVFCNCDDAVGKTENTTSAFALFFLNNFKKLGLKKLICTHFGGGLDLFGAGRQGYIFTKNGFRKYDSPRGYTGCFSDPISIKILNEEADIVCTNPPFSRAIEYWKLLVESGKQFLIISNETNIINTAYIPYFMNNKVWAGYHSVYHYYNPKREIVRASGRWYTNFPISERPTYNRLKIVPLKEIPKEYIKYDDNKKLLVDNGYIPSDYNRPFAVSSNPLLNGLLEKGYKIIQGKRYTPYVNGKEKFARVLVKKI